MWRGHHQGKLYAYSFVLYIHYIILMNYNFPKSMQYREAKRHSTKIQPALKLPTPKVGTPHNGNNHKLYIVNKYIKYSHNIVQIVIARHDA